MIFTQLRSFHAVATEGGFTAAAKVLNIEQPTVTSQVKALEERYQVELFVRKGRVVLLTPAGEHLLELSKKIMVLESDARELLREYGGFHRGSLRVGAVGPYHATEMLSLFHERYPKVDLRITIGNSHEVLNHLHDLSVDVAVLAHVQEDPQVEAIPFSRHPVVAFVHTDHPWSQKKAVSIKDFQDQPVIMREQGSTTRLAFERALDEANVQIERVMEIGSREATWMAVARKLGIGVVSDIEFIPAPNLTTLAIRDAEIYTIAHVAYLKARQHSRIIQAFIEITHALKSQYTV